MNQEIQLSEARANSQATLLLSTAQAQAIRDALNLERDAISKLQSTFNKWQDNDFNLAVVWIRTIEKKIEQGSEVTLMGGLPLF